MAIEVWHVQVIFPAISGIARDESMNTLTFRSDAATDGDALNAMEYRLDRFYNTVNTSRAISAYLSGSRSRVALHASRRYYKVTAHLNGTPAGPPVFTTGWTPANAVDAGHPLPEETAVCLSYHGDDSSIPEFAPGARPRSRHRGRIFLGPLCDDNSVKATDSANYLRVGPALAQDLVDAAARMRADSASTDGEWVVWSRRNAAVYPVSGGWVDNAFDSQRRRGPDPTSRLDVPPPV